MGKFVNDRVCGPRRMDDGLGETARASGSENAKAGFWIADLRPWCRNPKVRCISQFSTAAECETVNGGDYRHWQPEIRWQRPELMPARASLRRRSRSCIMSAPEERHPGSKLRPGKDEGPGTPLQIPAHGVQFVHHELADGIANFWPIEFNMDGRADVVGLKRFAHATFALLINKGPIHNQRMIITQ